METNFKKYLDAKKIRQRAFAESIGISKAYMSDLVNGKRSPSFAVARKINDATNGEVDFDSWPVSA